MKNVCNECGKTDYQASYLEGETKKTMDELEVCFSCAFWINQNKRKNQVVIKGSMYSIGSGGNGGMAGRKFIIKMNDGKVKETHDLWHQGTVPDHFKERMPDNAEFMGGAEKCEFENGSGCFKPST